MASATATKNGKNRNNKNNRWFRISEVRPDLPEFDQLLDLYWGGPERRLTGITMRIIGVNATALLILMLGILYLGQYQSSVIEARLETFQSELELIAASLTQSVDEPLSVDTALANKTRAMIADLSYTSHQRITLFNPQGELAADSFKILKTDHVDFFGAEPKPKYHSVQVLKDMAAVVLSLFPERRNILPRYEEISPDNAKNYPNLQDAREGNISLSVWHANQNRIFLTAAAPLYKNDQLYGTVLLTREGQDIKDSISEVWLNVLKVFSITLIFTTLLSIYLSGVIARPLRNLAKAAEAVRRGQAKAEDIPDLSHRHDEIGELSLVLRQMTRALWERMDSIEQVAADVAHELKNPLTSLRSAVETASIVKTEADREKLMNIIRHDVARLDRLISDISSASRLDAELSREEFRRLNLTELLQHFLDSYANPLTRQEHKTKGPITKIETENVTISLNSGLEDVFVWGVESRLGQVFQNLVSNAISFSPKGGEISITLLPLRRRVSIVIEDNGPGIPESKRETIFERFYSERPDHEQFGLHSGLGLSICKHIVEAHGGGIFADNIKDAAGHITGARFTVLLNKA